MRLRCCGGQVQSTRSMMSSTAGLPGLRIDRPVPPMSEAAQGRHAV
jgi:hypothetical protein